MQPERFAARALGRAPHGFFTRRGGVSSGIYAGLNCGPGSADDAEAVQANRAAVAEALGCAPERLLTAHQVHGAEALAVAAPWRGARPRVDALVTAAPGLAVGALAADCAPVLFADEAAGVVAAAHAGWRGALAGVLEATVARMETLGAERARIAAVVGPCISQSAYEVGPEFLDAFLAEAPGAERFFVPGAEGRPEDRLRFDLPGFCLSRLREAGVGAAEWLGRCTYGDPERFFSFRRATHAGEPDYGRLIAAIATPT